MSINFYCRNVLNSQPTISQTLQVANSEHKPFVIPADFIPQGVAKGNGLIKITADKPVGLYAMHSSQDMACDGYVAVNTDTMGVQYYIVTFDQMGKHLSEFVIMAHGGSTSVTITLPNLGSSVQVIYNGLSYHSDNVLTVTLEEMELFQVQSGGDLSGTKVVSNKPIGVLAGSVETAAAPLSVLNPDTNHIVDTLLPVDQWGNLIFTVPVSNRNSPDILKVFNADYQLIEQFHLYN